MEDIIEITVRQVMNGKEYKRVLKVEPSSFNIHITRNVSYEYKDEIWGKPSKIVPDPDSFVHITARLR